MSNQMEKLKSSIENTIKDYNINIGDKNISDILHDIAYEYWIDESDAPKKVGEIYEFSNLEYLEWIENGNDPDLFPYEKSFKTKVIYVSIDGSYVLEEIDTKFNGNSTFDGMVFSGKSIKMSYTDFEGDDDKYYVVTYSENSPFYQ
jgi:hypothetical protein